MWKSGLTDSHILWVASSVVMLLAVPFQRCRYYYCCCCCYGDWLPGGVDSEVGCYSRLPRDVLHLRPRTPPAPRPEVPQSAKLVLVLPQSVRNANKQNKEDKFRNCPVGQRTLSVAHKVNSISFYRIAGGHKKSTYSCPVVDRHAIQWTESALLHTVYIHNNFPFSLSF